MNRAADRYKMNSSGRVDDKKNPMATAISVELARASMVTSSTMAGCLC